jgi:hypothetical protein
MSTACGARLTQRHLHLLGLAYAWSGAFVMWVFWICFVVFLANPRWVPRLWPLPTVDHGGIGAHQIIAGLIALSLISLFGLQHSLMALVQVARHGNPSSCVSTRHLCARR